MKKNRKVIKSLALGIAAAALSSAVSQAGVSLAEATRANQMLGGKLEGGKIGKNSRDSVFRLNSVQAVRGARFEILPVTDEQAKQEEILSRSRRLGIEPKKLEQTRSENSLEVSEIQGDKFAWKVSDIPKVVKWVNDNVIEPAASVAEEHIKTTYDDTRQGAVQAAQEYGGCRMNGNC